MKPLLFVFVGLFAGILSGLFGIGGALIIIPALVLIFGFSQQLAQGTTLALMIPPIGILAAIIYYKQGFVNLPAAIFICLGFVVGGYIGAKYAVNLNSVLLQRSFGVLLLIISIKFIISK